MQTPISTWLLCAAVLFGGTRVSHAESAADKQADSQPGFLTRFEQSDGRETAEYAEGIRYYSALADAFPQVQMRRFGLTDSGRPLHAVMVSGDSNFNMADIRKQGRAVLLVNNAIHPGESDGVDASMLFLRELVTNNKARRNLPDNVFVAIIPYYNIGGALNRNRFTRANQNGPEEYGFRGNARNFDLNRDFVKCDTLNARSFAELFHYFDPDLFIDTHVTNGSDYQHVMTTTHSQKDKLGGQLSEYLETTFEPTLFARMGKRGYPTIPYVNAFGGTPDKGWTQFLETPRYSTGYTALFHTMGFMTETHMLKPYAQRVDATREFLHESLQLLAEQGQTIRRLRTADRQAYSERKAVPLTWKVDRTRSRRLPFMGYEARMIDSKVTSGQRRFYDRDRPFTREVNYYNSFVGDIQVPLPAGYLIPQGQRTVLELLRLNRVQLIQLSRDIELNVEVYSIDDTSHASSPYEGHYFHSRVDVSRFAQRVKAKCGDFLVPIKQLNARYVVETLEPQAVDSLFRWNYFDTILERKEHYSSYVFEQTAERLLAEDAALRERFEQRKQEDGEFAESRRQQLDFLYRHSPHAEPAYRRYPIYRLTKMPAVQ